MNSDAHNRVSLTKQQHNNKTITIATMTQRCPNTILCDLSSKRSQIMRKECRLLLTIEMLEPYGFSHCGGTCINTALFPSIVAKFNCCIKHSLFQLSLIDNNFTYFKPISSSICIRSIETEIKLFVYNRIKSSNDHVVLPNCICRLN